jgi:hypothetical protein
MEKQGAHNSHATAAENGANHGFLGVQQSAVTYGTLNLTTSATNCLTCMTVEISYFRSQTWSL